ncbi:hypothetical protein P9112_009375 [Eukaryota sp. TZLM1-RC]
MQPPFPFQQTVAPVPTNPYPIDPARHHPPHAHQSRHAPVLVDSNRLQSILRQIDPEAKLHNDVETKIQEFSQKFLEDVASGCLELAKHRGGESILPKDIALILHRFYDITIPGSDLVVPPKVVPSGASHKQRLEVVNRNIRQQKTL